MRRLIGGVVLLVVSGVTSLGPVLAQTHPCDLTITPNPQLTSPVRAGFCHDGRDAEGNSTTITAFRVRFNGAVVFDGPLAAIGAPNAAGLSFFETAPIGVSRGNISVTVSAVSADGEGAQSSPFVFGVVGAVPSTPTRPRVRK